MGKDLYEASTEARELMERANGILSFRLTDIMFEGSDEDLRQTKVTQPAVFLHSVALAASLGDAFQPDMVGGHSLGELSAMVAAGVLTLEDGMLLVHKRALAMQKACEMRPGTMAAIIGLSDDVVEAVCKEVSTEASPVRPANYNNPGQLVISGAKEAVEAAMEKLKEAGAKRALPLSVGGAFHSPLMEPAREELAAAIEGTKFMAPRCPVYQNVDGEAHTDTAELKANLKAQLTASVLWTHEVENMMAAGATEFIECGPGKALQGMIGKIARGHEGITVTGA